MDQSARYSDLSLKEEDLMKGEKHILVAYKMKPKAGYGYLEAAAHFAAESSTGTNVEVSTTDDFTKGVDALVYYIDEATEDMRIAYPIELFDRNVTDGRFMLVSFLTLAIGNNQGMGDIEHAKMIDFYVPARAIQMFDGPSRDISDMWRILGRPIKDGGYISGTIIKPKLGLRPEPFAKAAYQFWLGGDFIKNDEPQGNQVFCPLKKVLPLVYDSMKRAQDETGQAKLFSLNITADDHYEMMRPRRLRPGNLRSRRRQAGLPGRRLRRRPRHGDHRPPSVPQPVPALPPRRPRRRHLPQSAKRGYTAFVLAKMSRLQGASGIHVGTMGYGKMEGETSDKIIAYMIERDECQGPVYYQKWYGMKPTTPIISGGMNALRLPGFFENLGHGNVINTSGGGSYGHIDSPAAGAISLRQSYECWKAGADPIEYAKEHKEFARAFESFPGDADKLYPGWREKLGVHK
jgi:ribulose-bisphosphate carboxylase large chain